MKNKTISDLVLRHNRLKQEITDLQQIQQHNREVMKVYDSSAGKPTILMVGYKQNKKKIKKLNKEQNIRNNKK